MTTTDTARCRACNDVLAASPLVCAECGKIQPPGEVDYFRVFSAVTGGHPRLVLDLSALESEFHRLSRRLHPDRFAHATTEEQTWSLAATALLNDAYRALRDPIQRTEYLLQLLGYAVGEQHAGRNKTANRQPPADLLEEVFELNMQLEEMRANRAMGEDDPTLSAELAQAREHYESLLATVDSELTEAGVLWDAAGEAGDDAARNRAVAAASMAALLDRRRYLRNLVRDVHDVLAVSAG